jgi:hypothetical protein
MRCESWWGTVQPTKRTSTYHSNFGPLPANLTSTSLSKANISESQFPKSVGQALALSFSLRELRSETSKMSTIASKVSSTLPKHRIDSRVCAAKHTLCWAIG